MAPCEWHVLSFVKFLRHPYVNTRCKHTLHHMLQHMLNVDVPRVEAVSDAVRYPVGRRTDTAVYNNA